MKFDLHIHSCLSPCADLEMSPAEIVKRAVSAGMHGIALTDHQTARNTPAVAECARRAGLKCLFGMEVQTAEEVHTLALFDTVDQALALTDWVYEAMPKRVNDPDTFGDQPVVSWDDEIVEMEWRILAMGCRRTIPEAAAKIHDLGGLYIAAHIDRPNHSVYGALGCIPEPLPGEPSGRYFDAVELSRTADETNWIQKFSDGSEAIPPVRTDAGGDRPVATAGYAVIRSSDAHNLDDVARVWTEAEGEFSVAGLKAVFEKYATRISPRLTSF